MNVGSPGPAGSHAGARVAIITSLIGAAAVVSAALIGVDAKRDRESANSALAIKDAEIRSLQLQLTQTCTSSTSNGGVSTQVPEPGDDSKDPIPNTGVGQVRENGFLVELNSCSLRGDELDCQLLATALTEDASLTFNSWSRVVESDGTEILASRIQLGKDQARGQTTYVRSGLVRNVPMKMSVSFAGLNPSTSGKQVRLIELSFSGFAAQFHHVAVSK